MNVIVANEAKDMLKQLDIDVIKSVDGVHSADEIIDMFKNFFYARMILDITAIENYTDITNLQKISMELDADKIILVLPNNESSTSTTYLSKIISMGIYNFTTNLDGITYSLKYPNTYKDVAHIQQLNAATGPVGDAISGASTVAVSSIIGVKNITEHAGATTLVYMLKKELEQVYGMSIVAIEVNRHDFAYFNDKNMISVSDDQLMSEIVKHKDATVVLIDLNDSKHEDVCNDILYLVEPSLVKLNKLMRRNRRIFEELKGKKIILNMSLLSGNDIMDFEYEGKTKVFDSIPPLNDRERNAKLNDFLSKLGLINKPSDKEDNKLFGLFKR